MMVNASSGNNCTNNNKNEEDGEVLNRVQSSLELLCHTAVLRNDLEQEVQQYQQRSTPVSARVTPAEGILTPRGSGGSSSSSSSSNVPTTRSSTGTPATTTPRTTTSNNSSDDGCLVMMEETTAGLPTSVVSEASVPRAQDELLIINKNSNSKTTLFNSIAAAPVLPSLSSKLTKSRRSASSTAFPWATAAPHGDPSSLVLQVNVLHKSPSPSSSDNDDDDDDDYAFDYETSYAPLPRAKPTDASLSRPMIVYPMTHKNSNNGINNSTSSNHTVADFDRARSTMTKGSLTEQRQDRSTRDNHHHHHHAHHNFVAANNSASGNHNRTDRRSPAPRLVTASSSSLVDDNETTVHPPNDATNHPLLGAVTTTTTSASAQVAWITQTLERENAELRTELHHCQQTIADLQQSVQDLQKLVQDLRELPTGKISQIPIADMLEIMHEFGSEVSENAVPPRRDNVQKASVVRQFRRWNPNFLEYFIHKGGKWIPKLGKRGELERRARARAEAARKRGGAMTVGSTSGKIDMDHDMSSSGDGGGAAAGDDASHSGNSSLGGGTAPGRRGGAGGRRRRQRCSSGSSHGSASPQPTHGKLIKTTSSAALPTSMMVEVVNRSAHI